MIIFNAAASHYYKCTNRESDYDYDFMYITANILKKDYQEMRY